jgi:hypothetical protein
MDTEQKLRLENEVVSLKREYKHALENVSKVKEEVNELLSLKDRTSQEIDKKKLELDKVLEDISSEKLNWALERRNQLEEVAVKISEADNVIKRKAELNKQEEEIRQIEARDTEIRNEARRLEFKNEQDRTNLQAEKRALDAREKEIEKSREVLEKDKENFKKRVLLVIKEVEKL